MQSIIEELYYGNVLPFERRAPRGGEYARIIKYLSRNEEGLLETLTEAQKEIFEKFKANQAELNGIDEVTSFAIGFKLGLRLAAEAFVSAKPEFKEVIGAVRRGERKPKQKLDYDNGPFATALRGGNIRLEQAEKIAENLGCRTTEIFDVKKKTQPYAYETMHKIKRTLRAILSHAKKQRIINDNYASADYIDFPKRPQKEIDYMNDDDAKKFYAAADEYHDIRYKTAALLLLLTGIRRGEMAGLEWSNIDFEEATITIERSVTTVKGFGVVEKEPKTESSKRIISISDKLISTLKEYKTWYEQYKADMGDTWTGTDRLFISECVKRFYPGTALQWVHKICDAAGLPHRTVHSLRHTNITMQIAAGVPLVTVAGRAGHARTSTTTDIYSHFLKSSDKTAAEKLEQIFE